MSAADQERGSRFRIGTRGSALARWQTDHVKNLLSGVFPDLVIDVDVVTTRGDTLLGASLPSLGGKGLFTAELEKALLDGGIDIAVHSAKDLPTEFPGGLVIGAVARRANPCDVLVSARGFVVDTLPRGAVVGTSSPRRAAQLLNVRPDISIRDIRGNVDTRINKALKTGGDYDAILLAHAGLDRLGRLDVVTEVLDPDLMLPAPGQGALAVQCRDEESSLGIVRRINDAGSEIAVVAERAFLSGLGGGCALPICCLGVFANGRLGIRGRVLTANGTRRIDVSAERDVRNIDDARQLGLDLAGDALEKGAAGLLGMDQ
ncbi:MAG: hydroxymethylbilane synthase [bacterium]